jgi:hypothetical protein
MLLGTDDPPGSLKQSATASPSSGDGTPRRGISFFDSSSSFPSLVIEANAGQVPCSLMLSGSEISPFRAFRRLTYNSARGCSTGLPRNYGIDHVSVALLYQPVINANTQAAHIDIHLIRFVLADDLRNEARHFHRTNTRLDSIW